MQLEYFLLEPPAQATLTGRNAVVVLKMENRLMSNRGPGRLPVFRQENLKRPKKMKVEGWVPEDLVKEFDKLCAIEFRKRSEQIALLISQAVEKAKAEGKLREIKYLRKNSEG